jgi:hypothetical protein
MTVGPYRLSPGDQTIARWFRREHAMTRARALLLVVRLSAAVGCSNMTPT